MTTSANPEAPLFIGGGEDHVIPAKVSRKMAGKYRDASTVTDY